MSLVLSRRLGEEIVVYCEGHKCVIGVDRLKGASVRLSFTSTPVYRVYRTELFERIYQTLRTAVYDVITESFYLELALPSARTHQLEVLARAVAIPIDFFYDEIMRALSTRMAYASFCENMDALLYEHLENS